MFRAVKMVSKHDAKNRIANCGWEMKGNHPQLMLVSYVVGNMTTKSHDTKILCCKS